MISSFCEGGQCVDVQVVSSFCDSGACVIVKQVDTGVRVGPSDAPELGVDYTRDEWKAFVLGVKAGEFDFDLFEE